jgi:hypothetical protein
MSDELAYIMSCEDKAGALRLLIAAAVDLERERCAKIAEGEAATSEDDYGEAYDRGYREAAQYIAAVIRSKAQ